MFSCSILITRQHISLIKRYLGENGIIIHREREEQGEPIKEKEQQGAPYCFGLTVPSPKEKKGRKEERKKRKKKKKS